MAELTAPFPYFGSKRHAAGLIWQALGDVASYCEPFAGSLAVLLRRPGGPGRIETINDLSGHIANFWRSVKSQPEEVARHLDYPVIEQDLHARHRWLLARHADIAAGIDGDPDWCDPKAAGWWAWGASSWIGRGWCDQTKAQSKQLPSLSQAGTAVHSVGAAGRLNPWCIDLANRLRHTRVCCGDWRRVVTHSAVCDTLVAGRVGIVYDPPYAHAVDDEGVTATRETALYGAEDSATVAAECAEQARRQAVDHPRWRIVLCGYAGEHVMPGWREVAWSPNTGKFGSGGYGRKNGNSERERLWLSPACLPVNTEIGHQPALFT